mmetsp:Transcript_99966/g.285753  ORF Transcript_99966/g.285753 Transcript_99966/m.285753 type:complete len:236 (+) Transcript_99966:3596-4303(+)
MAGLRPFPGLQTRRTWPRLRLVRRLAATPWQSMRRTRARLARMAVTLAVTRRRGAMQVATPGDGGPPGTMSTCEKARLFLEFVRLCRCTPTSMFQRISLATASRWRRRARPRRTSLGSLRSCSSGRPISRTTLQTRACGQGRSLGYSSWARAGLASASMTSYTTPARALLAMVTVVTRRWPILWQSCRRGPLGRTRVTRQVEGACYPLKWGLESCARTTRKGSRATATFSAWPST